MGKRDSWSRAQRRAEKLARYLLAGEQMQSILDVLSPLGQCQKCGKTPRNRSLQLHHLDGRDWEPREHSLDVRVRRYADELAAGARLAAWCIQCNAGVHPDADAERAERILNRSTRGTS